MSHFKGHHTVCAMISLVLTLTVRIAFESRLLCKSIAILNIDFYQLFQIIRFHLSNLNTASTPSHHTVNSLLVYECKFKSVHNNATCILWDKPERKIHSSTEKIKDAEIIINKARLDLDKLEKSLTQGDCKFQIVSLELPTYYYYRNRKTCKMS